MVRKYISLSEGVRAPLMWTTIILLAALAVVLLAGSRVAVAEDSEPPEKTPPPSDITYVTFTNGWGVRESILFTMHFAEGTTKWRARWRESESATNDEEFALSTPSEDDISDGKFSDLHQFNGFPCVYWETLELWAYSPAGWSESVTPLEDWTGDCRYSDDLAPAPSPFYARGNSADGGKAYVRWEDGVSSKWRLTWQADGAEESNSVEIRFVPYGSSGREYTLSGLTCGTAYQFALEAYDTDARKGWWKKEHYKPGWSQPATASARTATCAGDEPPELSDPAIPANFRVTSQSMNGYRIYVLIESSPVDGIGSARIEYRAAGATEWDSVERTGNNYSYRLGIESPPLLCATTYEFRLRARGDGTTYNAVLSDPTPVKSAYTSDCPPAEGSPAKPTGLSSTDICTGANLTWDDPQDDSITGYQYRLDKGEWQDIPGSSATTTSYTLPKPSTAYDWGFRAEGFLRAVNAQGPGALASVRWVDIGWLRACRLDAPANLTATGDNGSITLNWDAPWWRRSVVTGYQYRLQQAEADWGDWQDISGSNSTTTSHTIAGLTDDNYDVQLRAVAEDGVGPPRRSRERSQQCAAAYSDADGELQGCPHRA